MYYICRDVFCVQCVLDERWDVLYKHQNGLVYIYIYIYIQFHVLSKDLKVAVEKEKTKTKHRYIHKDTS